MKTYTIDLDIEQQRIEVHEFSSVTVIQGFSLRTIDGFMSDEETFEEQGGEGIYLTLEHVATGQPLRYAIAVALEEWGMEDFEVADLLDEWQL